MHIKLEFMTQTSQVGKIEGEKERDGRCAVPTALGKNCHAKLYAPGFCLRVSAGARGTRWLAAFLLRVWAQCVKTFHYLLHFYLQNANALMWYKGAFCCALPFGDKAVKIIISVPTVSMIFTTAHSVGFFLPEYFCFMQLNIFFKSYAGIELQQCCREQSRSNVKSPKLLKF